MRANASRGNTLCLRELAPKPSRPFKRILSPGRVTYKVVYMTITTLIALYMPHFGNKNLKRDTSRSFVVFTQQLARFSTDSGLPVVSEQNMTEVSTGRGGSSRSTKLARTQQFPRGTRYRRGGRIIASKSATPCIHHIHRHPWHPPAGRPCGASLGWSRSARCSCSRFRCTPSPPGGTAERLQRSDLAPRTRTPGITGWTKSSRSAPLITTR
jgi:hypothetical protein